MSRDTYPQSFKAAALYEKTSANGNQYFTGRMGGVRVTLLRSKDVAEDGSAIWNLMFSEAPPPGEEKQAPQPRKRGRPPGAEEHASAKKLTQKPLPINRTVSENETDPLADIFGPEDQRT